jgi:SAM-dependent methyltransferase
MDDFYRAFEDRHRGSRELIKDRLAVYLPFVNPLLQNYPNAEALDLGCGRGEWLEVISNAGFKARGVDLDAGMLSACHERNLCVENQDALTALRTAPNSSLAVISAFHVVEHINFDDVRALIAESMRALVPGGLMILETPNPENIVVAGCNFYLDPTHQRPIPPQLLSFAVEHAGFERTKVLRLQEAASLCDEKHPLTLISVLEGVSPDYAVIGQKDGSREITEASSEVFARDFGMNLQTLANRFKASRLKTKHSRLKTKHSRLKTKHSRLKTKHSRLKTKHSRLKTKHSRLKTKHSRLKTKHSRLKTKHSRLKLHQRLR